MKKLSKDLIKDRESILARMKAAKGRIEGGIIDKAEREANEASEAALAKRVEDLIQADFGYASRDWPNTPQGDAKR